MGEKLSSDELGAAGEAQFEALCARAKLVCNKSNRDVTGWDFVVEFAMPLPGPSVALDQRPPTSCRVQLKSTAGRDPVSLRLSSAERLAKDVRPAFIVVFRLSPDGQGVVGYLVHLLGPALARVLKRLRTAHADKSWDVNHAKLSFDYRKFGDLVARQSRCCSQRSAETGAGGNGGAVAAAPFRCVACRSRTGGEDTISGRRVLPNRTERRGAGRGTPTVRLREASGARCLWGRLK